ncbi:hypothetical protein OIV19_21825 [Brucella sp. HL-2]|nr:hypothetical protein [Brucella sp. HL-2]MCV9910235.1 hypothetical protein [Brucella sp. HL-2]
MISATVFLLMAISQGSSDIYAPSARRAGTFRALAYLATELLFSHAFAAAIPDLTGLPDINLTHSSSAAAKDADFMSSSRARLEFSSLAISMAFIDACKLFWREAQNMRRLSYLSARFEGHHT